MFGRTAATTTTETPLLPPAPTAAPGSGWQMVASPEGWRYVPTKTTFGQRLTVKITKLVGRTVAVLLTTLALGTQLRAGVCLVLINPGTPPTFGDPAHASAWQMTASTIALLMLATAIVWMTDPPMVFRAIATTGVLTAAAACGTGVGLGHVAHRWPRATILSLGIGWTLTPALGGWFATPQAAITGGAVLLPAAAGYRFTRWLAERRKPAPPPPAPVVAEEVAIWRTLVAARAETLPDGTRVEAGPLPGCLVSDHVEPVLRDGETVGFLLRIRGRDLKQNVDTFRTAVPAVAAAYQTTPDGVTVVEVGDHQRAMVEVIRGEFLARQKAARKKRLMVATPMPGPLLDVTTGVVTVGLTADDGAPLQWTLWVPGEGARHGWIVGAQGSGKTGGLTEMLASACSAGVVIPHIIDLGRASLPEWKPLAASWATNVPDAVRVLQRMEMLYESRISWMEENADPVYPDPTPETPLHVLVIEEAPQLIGNEEAMRIVLRLVCQARKTGISVIWVTQFGNAAKAFGAAGTVMREQLKNGNIWMFNLSGETIAQALSGARDEEDDKLFNLADLGIPKGVTGACLAWTPKHPTPTLGRSWWLTNDRRAVDIPRWVVLPDFDWDTILPSDDDEDDDSTPIDDEVKGNAARVLAAIRQNFRPGDVVSTGKIAALVGDMRPSSLDYALNALVKRRKLIDGGHGKWSLAA